MTHNDISKIISNFKVNPRAEKQNSILSDAIKLQKKHNIELSVDNKWSKIMKLNLTKIAAAAIILIALIITFSHNGISPDGASIAWADVIKQLNTHEKYKCHQIVMLDNGTTLPEMEVIHVNLSLRRQEADDGTIHIINMQNEDAIVVRIVPDQQKATVTKMLGFGPKKDPDIIDMVKRFDQESTERLGTKELNGKTLYGFKHKPNEHNEFTVWVDAGDKLPVEIELRHPTAGQTIYMDDFDFDFEYNPEDFSTDVPEGYEVETIINDYRPTEPKTAVNSDIAEYLNHTAYDIAQPEWADKSCIIETTDPLGTKAKVFITAFTAEDDNIIMFIQGNYYDINKMVWINQQQLLYTADNGIKLFSHPNGEIYAEHFLKCFAKAEPNFTKYEIEPQRQTYMITMPDGAVIGMVSSKTLSDQYLADITASITPIESD